MTPSMAGFDFRPYVIKSTSRPRYARMSTAGMNVKAVGNSHVSSPCREAARRNQLDGWKLLRRSWEDVSMVYFSGIGFDVLSDGEPLYPRLTLVEWWLVRIGA